MLIMTKLTVAFAAMVLAPVGAQEGKCSVIQVCLFMTKRRITTTATEAIAITITTKIVFCTSRYIICTRSV
jgi:hypothetical protein